jgi:hypothetical protein
VRDLSIYAFKFFIPIDLQAEFPTCETRGVGVFDTSTYQSIPSPPMSCVPNGQVGPRQCQSSSPIHREHFLYNPTTLCGFLFACFPNTSPVLARVVNFHALFTHPQTMYFYQRIHDSQRLIIFFHMQQKCEILSRLLWKSVA